MTTYNVQKQRRVGISPTLVDESWETIYYGISNEVMLDSVLDGPLESGVWRAVDDKGNVVVEPFRIP